MIKSIGHVVVLNNIPFKIEEKKVLRELRIPRSIETLKDMNEEHIARDIKNAINLAYTLIKGAGCYRTFKVVMTGGDTPLIKDNESLMSHPGCHPEFISGSQTLPSQEIPKQVRDDRQNDRGYDNNNNREALFSREKVVIPESDSLFQGGNILRLLKKCDYATLLVCTIGENIVKKIELLTKSSIADAFYLERVAAWMADYMAEQVGAKIEAEIRKNGYEPTFRYAAGYGDWGLEAQSEIMRLTEAEKIGISITESFIMEPRFSVSAVIGWARKSNIKSESDDAKFTDT